MKHVQSGAEPPQFYKSCAARFSVTGQAMSKLSNTKIIGT